MVTRDTLITAFPEFGDETLYPTSQIDFWISQAYTMLPVNRFGAQIDLGVMLYVAHQITLSARAVRASATRGGVAGMNSGLMTSKSLGKVSASYDVNLTAIQGAGPWNATIYGQRFYALAKAFLAGPIYVPGVSRGGLVPDRSGWLGLGSYPTGRVF